jgi:hypothetical protein
MNEEKPWYTKAACVDMYDYFDYDSDTCPVPLTVELDEQLRKICDKCPVRLQCFDDALDNGDWQTFRAGMNPRQWKMVFAKMGLPAHYQVNKNVKKDGRTRA